MQKLVGNKVFNMDFKMEFVKRVISNLKRIQSLFKENNTISKSIIYKIIDQDENNIDTYIMQCINSKAIFQAHITEIIFDTDILYGLHPLQSCFIGIEYTQYIKSNKLDTSTYLKKINIQTLQAAHGYETLKVKYQDRKGNICFINSCSNEEDIMSPKEIAFSDKIIGKFNSAQAFFIGMCAGQKLNNSPENIIYFDNCKFAYLKKTQST